MLVNVNPGAKIRYIPPDYSPITRRRRKDSKLRVAAYCRVSSKNNNQEPSLENQVKYFTELIRSNKKWYFSGVFTDIKSGRNSDRPGLNKLFKKCERGKVDRVIIKSMSRFTRNTLDAFVIVRYLTSIGVDVFFEKENIHTLYQRGELIFSIYAALVQFEGQSISENTKWGIRKSAEDPDSKFFNRPCYGYRRSEDGKTLVIVKKEAEVVRLIYSLHDSGMGAKKIIKELKNRDIPSPTGKPIWSIRSVQRILTNEKYRGNVLIYKHYIADYPDGKKIRNQGQHVQYLVEGHHESIIKTAIERL